MSVITKKDLKKNSEKFVMTDPNNPNEILLNMALNGCGRTDSCTNKHCLDNPSTYF